jgi:hypothetical protein
LNEWILVILVYDGNYSRIYFNNVMQSERFVGSFNFTGTTAPLTIGKWVGRDVPWLDSIDGIIDEVRFSSIARHIGTVDTTAWDVFYSAIKLPDESEPPWELRENFEGTAANVSHGLLTIDTTSESRYWNYLRYWNASSSVGVTVEANLTVLKASIYGELELNIADGAHATELMFFEGRVALFNVGEYLMDTDRFHIYRIVARENDIFLYVDGELKLDGTGRFTYDAQGENRVLFGDARTDSLETSGAVSAWNYVAYTVKGAFPAPPDLTVTEVKPSKTVVCQGYNLYINVKVTNYGSETETFNVTTYCNQTAIMIEQWPDGANSQIFWSKGDVNRDGYIDDWDRIAITQAFGSDVDHPRWNPDADINSDGKVDQKDLGACAKNYGKDIWRSLEIPKLIENQRVVTLPSGNSAIITFRCNTTGVVKGNYTISAHSWPVPGETDTGDNTCTDGTITVAMVGDLNIDGVVNILDISFVARAFGSEPNGTELPRWNSNADVNGDGTVNILDVGTVARNFGKRDP